jgi:hypothetical protein
MIRKSYQIFQKLRAFAIKSCIDGRFDESNVLILTASPRSGSTWLGNILRAIPKSCLLFEPLQLNRVPDAKRAGFSWRTFVAPQTQWPEGKSYLKRVFEGRVVNEWTSREMSFNEARRAILMIIKFVRANRLLPWMCRTFELRSPILFMRHPCAVIASQLKSHLDWGNPKRPEPPGYIDNYPAFKSALFQTEGLEEYLAATWALDQLPPLMEEPPRPWKIVTYEALFLRTEETVSRICHDCNLQIDIDVAMSKIKKPSKVVYKSGISGIDGWKKQLTDAQISRIIKTVQSFGIHFYNHTLEPNYDLIYGRRSAEQIREAGNQNE